MRPCVQCGASGAPLGPALSPGQNKGYMLVACRKSCAKCDRKANDVLRKSARKSSVLT